MFFNSSLTVPISDLLRKRILLGMVIKWVFILFLIPNGLQFGNEQCYEDLWPWRYDYANYGSSHRYWTRLDGKGRTRKRLVVITKLKFNISSQASSFSRGSFSIFALLMKRSSCGINYLAYEVW